MNDFGFFLKDSAVDVDRMFSVLQKQVIPKATVRALNRTADEVKLHLAKKVLPKYIDRPTRWTLNSVYTRYANQKRLEAAVFLKGSNGGVLSYLDPLIEGGSRLPKSFEKRLRRSGLIRGSQFAVPGADMRLDKFGNITKATSAHILRDVQAFTESGSSQNTSRKARKYFILPKAPHKPVGVYYRQGKKLKQAIAFTDEVPNYDRRLPFYEEAQKSANKHVSKEFSEAAKYYEAKATK